MNKFYVALDYSYEYIYIREYRDTDIDSLEVFVHSCSIYFQNAYSSLGAVVVILNFEPEDYCDKTKFADIIYHVYSKQYNRGNSTFTIPQWYNRNRAEYLIKLEFEKYLNSHIVKTHIIKLTNQNNIFFIKPTRVVIPKDCIIIDPYAFYGNEYIKEVFISKNVKKIDSFAFKNCANLRKVIFEKDSELLEISDKAFELCSIESLILPDKLELIGDEAFAYNTALNKTDIIIPQSVRRIGSQAFYGIIFNRFEADFSKKESLHWKNLFFGHDREPLHYIYQGSEER